MQHFFSKARIIFCHYLLFGGLSNSWHRQHLLCKPQLCLTKWGVSVFEGITWKTQGVKNKKVWEVWPILQCVRGEIVWNEIFINACCLCAVLQGAHEKRGIPPSPWMNKVKTALHLWHCKMTQPWRLGKTSEIIRSNPWPDALRVTWVWEQIWRCLQVLGCYWKLVVLLFRLSKFYF